MKRAAVLALLALPLVSCGGTKYVSAEKLGLQKPIIDFVGLQRSTQTPARGGAGQTFIQVDLRAALRVHNPNGVPIHIEEVRTSLRAPSFEIQQEPTSRNVGIDILAGQTHFVEIDFTGIATTSTVVLFPLSMKGRMYLNSPSGAFSVSFVNQYDPSQDAPDVDPDSDAGEDEERREA